MSDPVSDMRLYARILTEGGLPGAEIEERVRAKCSEENVGGDDLATILAELPTIGRQREDQQRLVEEVRTNVDLDGIKQTLRDHQRFALATAISVATTLGTALGLGWYHGRSGFTIPILWLVVAWLSTLAVRRCGRCVDGLIRGLHLAATVLGFFAYLYVSQLVTALAAEPDFMENAGLLAHVAVFVASTTMITVSGLLIVIGAAAWAWKFSVISIGPAEIARAKALQAAAPQDYSGHSVAESPY